MHSLLAGAWLNPSCWIILPHCLFSVLVTVSPVLICFSKQSRLHPAICTCTVKAWLSIFSFFMVSGCFPVPCTCSAERKSWWCSPSQCVWVWLSCCWVPGRRKGWITAGCPFAHRVSWALQTTLILPLEFWVWGQPVRLVLLALIGGVCLALQLEKAPWHCCSLE